MIKVLETVGTVTHTHTHTHTSNLIKEKSQAFLCFICDIYER